jgi:acetylglutamate kinase
VQSRTRREYFGGCQESACKFSNKSQKFRRRASVILVHGRQKVLNRRLSQVQLTSHFIDGLRVIDAETLASRSWFWQASE